MLLTGRGELADGRSPVRNRVHVLHRKIIDPRLAGDGQGVQDRVGTPAHGHVKHQGVFEGPAVDDVPVADPLPDQIHDPPATFFPVINPGRIKGRDRAVAGQRHAQRFRETVHRVGGKHPRAGAGPGAGAALQTLQRRGLEMAGGILGDRLKDRDQVGGPLAGFPGQHRPARCKDGGHIGPRRPHVHPGDDLVAIGNKDHAVKAVGADHRFDAIGDQLARGQGVLHPAMAHGDPVADGDGVEFKRHAARLTDGRLDDVRDLAQMDVPRYDLAIRIGHPDKGLAQVLTPDSAGVQQGAMGSTLGPALDIVTVHCVPPWLFSPSREASFACATKILFWGTVSSPVRARERAAGNCCVYFWSPRKERAPCRASRPLIRS